MVLSERRLTPERGDNDWHVPVAADTVIQAGALVMMHEGYALPGAAATGRKALGRAEERADNSGGEAGDVLVRVRRGIFRWDNSADTDAIALANIGDHAWIVDDHTVAKTSGTNTRSIAGRIEDVDEAGVWVATGFGLTTAPGGALLAANNLADLGAAATARTNLAVNEGMGTPGIVVGAQAGDDIVVSIQLKTVAGADLAVRGSVLAYLSDDANGDSLASQAPDAVAIGTDGLAIPLVAGKAFALISEADGDIDIAITENGEDTWYLILVMPNGRLVASTAITFAT